MKQKFGWTVLVLLLSMLIPSTSALAQEIQDDKDVLDTMMNEGWQAVAPGVLQRNRGGNKVETFAIGPEGLRWAIKQLQTRLTFLKREYRTHRTVYLQRAIASYQTQIASLKRDLARSKDQDDSMADLFEKVGCSVSYSSNAIARGLASAAGIEAVASAGFNNNCGYYAETYASSYARATRNGLTETLTQTDPRSGYNISSSATAAVQGTVDCYSEAYSYARYSSANIFLSFFDSSSTCSTVPAPTVTVNGPTWASFTSASCATKSWSATISGGTPGYAYYWYYNNTLVGTGSTYSRSVCYNHADFTLRLDITDSGSPAQSASDTHPVDVSYSYGGGGGGGCYSTSAGNKLENNTVCP